MNTTKTVLIVMAQDKFYVLVVMELVGTRKFVVGVTEMVDIIVRVVFIAMVMDILRIMYSTQVNKDVLHVMELAMWKIAVKSVMVQATNLKLVIFTPL